MNQYMIDRLKEQLATLEEKKRVEIASSNDEMVQLRKRIDRDKAALEKVEASHQRLCNLFERERVRLQNELDITK